MPRTAKKTTASKQPAKKTAAKPRKTTQAAQKCAYGDERPAVAVRDTPRGPRPLCDIHAHRARSLLGAEVKDL